jgi:hypothetical protein
MMRSSGFGLLALQLTVEQVLAMTCEPIAQCLQETHARSV